MGVAIARSACFPLAALAATATLTACGVSDDSRSYTRRANQVCTRQDPRIQAAESLPTYFPAAAIDAIDNEVHDLVGLGKPPDAIGRAIAVYLKARDPFTQGELGLRDFDAALLRAKQLAASVDIRCQFGSRPLLGLP
jgi:hypothetical protein